jgi:hypothetical protein
MDRSSRGKGLVLPNDIPQMDRKDIHAKTPQQMMPSKRILCAPKGVSE